MKNPERLSLTTLWALVVSPVVAQGLWRPLGHFWGLGGSAQQVTLAALAIVGLGALLRAVLRPSWAPLAGGILLALGAGGSLGLAALGALLAVAAVSGALLQGVPSRLPSSLDGLAKANRSLTLLWLLGALVAVATTSRVSIFIGDPTAVELQVLPGNKFTEVHSCLSAYERALDLARGGETDLYADHWWFGSNGLPPLPSGTENPYRPFELDNFNYPPTFLLISSPLTLLNGDFLAQRAFWFGLNGLLAALGLWRISCWFDGPNSHRILLLTPLFLGSPPVLLVLQIGNFHLSALVLSLLAMVAFERQQAVSGGALLASTILSKISPGILGVVLLRQRRFREAFLAAGFGLLLLVITLLSFGPGPILSFLGTSLPHLSSGAAFPFMQTDAGLVTNMSPFGIPFKLQFLGVGVGDPWLLGPRIARLYTLGLLLVALARRPGDRRDQAIRWMALLTLAALQSPFCPAYAMLGLLWASTLLSAEVRRSWQAFALFALWPALLVVPTGWTVPHLCLLSMAQTTLALVVAGWLALRPSPLTLDKT